MANMFRCVLASGGALILTVTCDSAFAGQTITCTDGTTTLTQICPSTSPYTVEFRIPNSGTWTISSGTSSTSVTIPSSVELHDIPNGSTITPTDVIETWLHCANIWDKSYTTITQVLNDVSTLQALIASNNAADYMARSTTWASNVTADSSAMTYIGLNDYCAAALLDDSTWLNAICNSSYFENVLTSKVPAMTSNTEPSGVCSASSTFNANYYAPYFPFRSSVTAAAWYGPNTAGTASQVGHWLKYEFDNNTEAYRYDYVVRSTDSASSFKIQGSFDDSTWEDLTPTINVSVSSGNISGSGIFNTHKKFKYYRLYILSGTASMASGSGLHVYSLQFYGRL